MEDGGAVLHGPRERGRCWVTLGACALGVACSLQDFSYLNNGGSGEDAGTSGDAGAGAVAGAGGDPGIAGAPAGGAGAGAAGLGGGAGTGGAGATAGVGGTGGVGGAGGFAGVEEDAGPDANLVADPGFEQGFSGWGVWGSVLLTWESQGPYAGGRCLRASSRRDAWAGPLYSLRNVITPGGTYRVSAWLRTPHVDQQVKITTKTLCVGETSSTFAEVFSLAPVQNYWQRYSGEFIAPSCELEDFALYVEGPPAGEDIYIDEFRVEPAPPL